MPRELTPHERMGSWSLCQARFNRDATHPWRPATATACPTCRADIVRLVDGEKSRDWTAALEQAEDAVRRLHHYGYPPDSRLQNDVDGDVESVTDFYRTAFVDAPSAAGASETGPSGVDSALEIRLRDDAERLRSALRVHGAHSSSCDILMLLTSDPPLRKPCSCGLAAALAVPAPIAVRADAAPAAHAHQWVAGPAPTTIGQRQGFVCSACGLFKSEEN